MPAALVASRYLTLTRAADDRIALLFNAFTGALLELDPETADRLRDWAATPGAELPPVSAATVDRLIAAGAAIPAGMDEARALAAIRETALGPGGPLLLTIAPSLQCNFRCGYCFETHRAEQMTPDVEDHLIAFAANRMDEASSLTVTWFGGEPLLAPKTIERVQAGLDSAAAARSLPVSRSIVTNGHLLTAPMVERLAALGPWTVVQVTIDGTPETHDSRRPHVSGRGTFDRIVANCRHALERGLPIAIRINFDRTLVHRIDVIVDRLIAEQLLPGARLQVGFLVDSTAICAHVREDVLPERERARVQLLVDAELIARGLPPASGLPQPQCGPLCSVEAPLGFVVAPGGLLFKCWNQVDRGIDEAIGHLDGRPVPNAAREAARWRKQDPFARPGCVSCAALPVCRGGCPWEAERLGRRDRGECDPFRFFPAETVQVAHHHLVRGGMVQPAVPR